MTLWYQEMGLSRGSREVLTEETPNLARIYMLLVRCNFEEKEARVREESAKIIVAKTSVRGYLQSCGCAQFSSVQVSPAYLGERSVRKEKGSEDGRKKRRTEAPHNHVFANEVRGSVKEARFPFFCKRCKLEWMPKTGVCSRQNLVVGQYGARVSLQSLLWFCLLLSSFCLTGAS